MLLNLAITGGTGFVGGHAITEALNRGHQVRALTRRPQPPRDGVVWVEGSLGNRASLAELVSGADVVVHIAGVTNPEKNSEFTSGNIVGTGHLRQAAGDRPLVHLSSLSAREPHLSAYGLSKLRGEQIARGASGPVTVVRPPAVYGPGDEEYLALMKAAQTGMMPAPAKAVTAMIYGPDLAKALIALAEDLAGPARSAGGIYEIDDGAGGYSQAEVADAIGHAIGQSVKAIELPPALIRAAAFIDTNLCRLAGRKAKLTSDRAGYFSHPDWSVNGSDLAALNLWKPEVGLHEGLRNTAIWYREKGLLKQN